MNDLTVNDYTAASIVFFETTAFCFMINCLIGEMVRGWFEPAFDFRYFVEAEK